MVRSFEPQPGPEELARNPHRFTVSGTGDAQMPGICANCRAPTDMKFPVQKVFLMRWRSVNQTAKRWTTQRGMTDFAIRDDHFAEAFATKNAARVVPERPTARRGH